jgi:hypothetical protein
MILFRTRKSESMNRFLYKSQKNINWKWAETSLNDDDILFELCRPIGKQHCLHEELLRDIPRDGTNTIPLFSEVMLCDGTVYDRETNFQPNTEKSKAEEVWVVMHQLPKNRIVGIYKTEKEAEERAMNIAPVHAVLVSPYPIPFLERKYDGLTQKLKAKYLPEIYNI